MIVRLLQTAAFPETAMRTLIALCVLALPLCLVARAQADKAELPFTLEDCKSFLHPEYVAEYAVAGDAGDDANDQPMRIRVKYHKVGEEGLTVESSIVGDTEAPPAIFEAKWADWWQKIADSITGTTATDDTVKLMGTDIRATRFVKTDAADEDASVTRTQWYSAKVPGVLLKSEQVATKKDGTVSHKAGVTLESLEVIRVDLPWTIEEMRAAYAAKLQITHEITDWAGEVTQEVTGMSAADENGFTIVIGQIKGDNKVAGKPVTVKWAECIRRLALPAKDTKISKETLTTDAGQFECIVYRHERGRMGGIQVETIWLCAKQPGVVIKEVTSVPGKGDPKVTTRILKALKQG